MAVYNRDYRKEYERKYKVPNYIKHGMSQTYDSMLYAQGGIAL